MGTHDDDRYTAGDAKADRDYDRSLDRAGQDERFEELLEKFIPGPDACSCGVYDKHRFAAEDPELRAALIHSQDCQQGPQDAPGDGQGQGGRHPAYIALDGALARLGRPAFQDEREQGYADIAHDRRQRAFQVIRKTLEDSGIPFLRANALAEKCYTALGEIL